MKKRWFFLGILLVLVFIAAAFVYFVLAKPHYGKQEVILEGNITVINVNHIQYLLNEMGAWQLHNPPLSSDMPKIEIRVDDNSFFAEVDKGIISVSEDRLDDVDLRISASTEELKNVLESGDVKTSIRDSVSDGKIQIEMISGYPTLFSKGYLSLYKELTGKSLTGSVVRIFTN